MIKREIVKKAYSKVDIEFVTFNYSEVIAASGTIEEMDDDEEVVEDDGEDYGDDSSSYDVPADTSSDISSDGDGI